MLSGGGFLALSKMKIEEGASTTATTPDIEAIDELGYDTNDEEGIIAKVGQEFSNKVVFHDAYSPMSPIRTVDPTPRNSRRNNNYDEGLTVSDEDVDSANEDGSRGIGKGVSEGSKKVFTSMKKIAKKIVNSVSSAPPTASGPASESDRLGANIGNKFDNDDGSGIGGDKGYCSRPDIEGKPRWVTPVKPKTLKKKKKTSTVSRNTNEVSNCGIHTTQEEPQEETQSHLTNPSSITTESYPSTETITAADNIDVLGSNSNESGINVESSLYDPHSESRNGSINGKMFPSPPARTGSTFTFNIPTNIESRGYTPSRTESVSNGSGSRIFPIESASNASSPSPLRGTTTTNKVVLPNCDKHRPESEVGRSVNSVKFTELFAWAESGSNSEEECI